MPAEGIDFAERDDLMTYEDIVRICKVMAGLGVSKVRLTGGEPFVRKEIGVLLQSLAQIFPSVHITTNATLLHKHMSLLQDIGVSGLNISIDSLERERFFMITRRDDHDLVRANIEAAIKHGLPTKLNVVVMKGVNSMEIIDFVQYGMELGVAVRFIEAMPFNDDDGNRDVFMPATDIVNEIQQHYPNLTKLSATGPSSADSYAIDDYRLGVIPAYTRSLCASCNRIRLTPKGELLTCLYAQTGKDMLSLLRNTATTDDDIAAAIITAVSHKKQTGYDEESVQQGAYRSMTTIGG